ncbi:protein NUCLEAR FUSION DEFECTIVE 4-like isoform X2 [Vicia villosa]|uniref:protein NUCLEAR FUSION DEFECTIVE 4-like isoform X2 n=1 Tax=Vicia villosa TaxID=3911 RepID=UPI00273C945F|nr:protein NUCLEAR FUSION DEFECTIVE 4-like isoform X2 [Vicia villosa]XP_058743039.1 protein NUCLEAR FUSION DEFECTIVE 4-like isoform X2 [Vicia villosa]
MNVMSLLCWLVWKMWNESEGFLGLSGAILIQVYRTIFNNNPVSYLLMLSLLPPINTLMLMWFVRIHNTHHEGESEKKYLNIFSLMSLVIAAYLMIVIILENILSLQLSIHILTFVVLMVLLASLLFVAFNANENRAFNNASESFLAEGSNNPLLVGDTNNRRRVQQGENLNLFEAVKTVNFWILFISMACGMGSGLTTVNNISQIGESLGYSTVETGSLVALWSIWNFLGRFGAGYVSDYFLHAKGCARPFFMVITLMVMSIGHVVIAYGLPGALYVGSILIGICYGSQWSLMPTIAFEIFGVRHMGSIFNTITMASPVGSYIFSVRVLGYMYDKEASEEGNICVGTHCFMFPFLIMASATILGSLIALCLFLRTRSFYGLVVLRRIQNTVR